MLPVDRSIVGWSAKLRGIGKQSLADISLHNISVGCEDGALEMRAPGLRVTVGGIFV
jgi:hypothetical protein